MPWLHISVESETLYWSMVRTMYHGGNDPNLHPPENVNHITVLLNSSKIFLFRYIRTLQNICDINYSQGLWKAELNMMWQGKDKWFWISMHFPWDCSTPVTLDLFEPLTHLPQDHWYGPTTTLYYFLLLVMLTHKKTQSKTICKFVKYLKIF